MIWMVNHLFFFFSSRRRHTRCLSDWSSDVCSSDLEACRSGLETGDFLYAAYGASTETWPAMLATQDLAQFVRDYSPNVALINKLKGTGFADSLKIILNWARALQGQTRALLSLSDDAIDEDK